MGVQRPDRDEYFLALAKVASTRSTCLHRHQGAVLVKDDRVISTGYNGSPPGAEHCDDVGWCAKDKGKRCRAEGLHAESNAVITAARMGIATEGATIYCLCSPCKTCCNILRTAGVAEVRYRDLYTGYKGGPNYLRLLGMYAHEVGGKG